MTDEQIVKALELESMPSEMNCIYANYIEGCGIYCDKKKCNAENCAGCKEHRMAYGGNRAKAILVLIKRQQAEIEEQDKAILNALKRMGEVRAEAAREFAERLKSKFASMEYQANTIRKTVRVDELKAQMDWILHEIVPQAIDELVKEMTEKEAVRDDKR